MASIPLPALHVNAPAPQEDALQKYAQLAQLRNQMQNAPLQRQALQQQVQSGQLELQQQQQAMQDQQAFRAAMQDPGMQGKTIGAIADTLASKGAISQQSWQAAKKADVEQRSALAKLDADTLANHKAAHDATQQLYSNVMNMPDDQLQANWAQIAQQYDAIPGNQKMPLDPSKPMTKQELAQFAPMISMANSYFDEELKRREAQTAAKTADVELKTKEQALQYGPTGPAADAKFSFLEKKLAQKQPITADDQAWMEGYKKQKLLVPATTAQIRIDGMSNSREYPVYDKKSGTTVMVTPSEINRAAKEEPGRYTAASYTPEAIGAKDTTEYFTKGAGGKQLTAFNTAMQHLDLLDKLGSDLNNSNLQIANKAKQAWTQQTGSPAPANFEAAKNAMSGEVAAALKTSGATDQEIAKVDSTFSRIQSPAQLKGAINTYRSLLESKAANLKSQYEQGMHGKPNFGGAGGSSSGVTVTAPNGKTYTFKDQASADAFKQKAGIQ